MSTASGLQRLEKLLLSQYRAYTADPFPYALAWVAPADVRVWYFLAGGLAEPFSGGEYIFRLTASDSYPSVPPRFEMLTPNGVYMPGGPACVAFGDRLRDEAPSARNAHGWWPDLGMRGFAAQVVCGLACHDALEGGPGAAEARVVRTPAPMKAALARASWGHNRRFLPEVMDAFEALLEGMPGVAPAQSILRARSLAPWKASYSESWPRRPIGAGEHPAEGGAPAGARPGPPSPLPSPPETRAGPAEPPVRSVEPRAGLLGSRAGPAGGPPGPGGLPLDRKASEPPPRRPLALGADPDDEDLLEAARNGVLDPDSDEDEPAPRALEVKSPAPGPKGGGSFSASPGASPGAPGLALSVGARSAAQPAALPAAQPTARPAAQPIARPGLTRLELSAGAGPAPERSGAPVLGSPPAGGGSLSVRPAAGGRALASPGPVRPPLAAGLAPDPPAAADRTSQTPVGRPLTSPSSPNPPDADIRPPQPNTSSAPAGAPTPAPTRPGAPTATPSVSGLPPVRPGTSTASAAPVGARVGAPSAGDPAAAGASAGPPGAGSPARPGAAGSPLPGAAPSAVTPSVSPPAATPPAALSAATPAAAPADDPESQLDQLLDELF